MSAEAVQNEILAPMQRLFLPPRNMDEGQQAQALREYVNALCNFEGADLKASWNAVRDTHTTRAWPVPAAFIMAAKQARSHRQMLERPRVESKADKNEAWDSWKEISKGPLARAAVLRNVAWSFKCAVLHDKKKPEQISLTELVSGKERAARLAAAIKDGSHRMAFRDAELALSMWSMLQVRETETQQEINYGGTP